MTVSVTRAMCVECGLDPASIVAARPLGLVNEPPPDPDPTVKQRAKAERDLERARREVARLEKELGIEPDHHVGDLGDVRTDT
jgi:hypothetical protein